MERRWKVLAVTGVAVFMGFLDVTIVNVDWFRDAWMLMAIVGVVTGAIALALGRVRTLPAPDARAPAAAK